MEYIIIITGTNSDGEQQEQRFTIPARNAREAHDAIKAAAANSDNVDSIRVYPNTTTAAGLARGAFQCARRMALNAIKRGGNPTQDRIERETAAINARITAADTAERITAVIAEYSADTQDFFGIAAAALMEGKRAGLDIAEQYHGAYIALNRHITKQRAATDFEISNEFITDGGGDVIAFSTAIARIIKGGEKYNPTDGGGMDSATAARLGAAIRAALIGLRPAQRQIVALMARGYSIRAIAEKTGRGVATVERNLAAIRAAMAAKMDNSEFSPLIESARVAAAAQAARRENATANARRTASGAAAKKASDKATQAARAAAYRARKKAEREAAANSANSEQK